MIILLEVLKWIGIVLLVVLLVIILLLLLILFVPFRYNIESEGSGNDIKANLAASWLFPILTIKYDFDLQNKIEKPLRIKVLGINIGRRKRKD